MYRNFKSLSFSYHTLSLEDREILSISEKDTRNLLKYFKEFTDLTDVLILSTCNRTEIYYASSQDRSEEILKIMGIVSELENSVKYLKFSDKYLDHQGAVKHLFRVSMGLESQVVGDIQVINQVKKAYQFSADEDMAGPFLHRLMHTIFYTNKRVTQETHFKDGAASLSYATVDLVKQLATNFKDPMILSIGLGEIGKDVSDNLKKWFDGNIYISNRTLGKSKGVAERNGFSVIPFENVEKAIQQADIIISSITVSSPLIHEGILNQNKDTKQYFIDLSVPRSISVNINDLKKVKLYNIDDIKETTSKSVYKRIKSIPDVEKIIDQSILELNEWSKEAKVYPTINKLKEALEELRREEIAKHLKEIDKDNTEIIERVTKSLIQKIIKYPVLHLKAACKRDEAEDLSEILHELFDLERKKIKK